MMHKIGLIFVIVATAALSACSPLVVGAGAVVVADEVIEREKGGDGLF